LKTLFSLTKSKINQNLHQTYGYYRNVDGGSTKVMADTATAADTTI